MPILQQDNGNITLRDSPFLIRSNLVIRKKPRDHRILLELQL
jgi:hypothetical protein